MKISERLKSLRKQHGLKLREVSKKTALSISYISDLERGRQNPSLETCQKMATVYEITLSEMFADIRLESGITQRALDSAPPYTTEELDIITNPRLNGALPDPPSQ